MNFNLNFKNKALCQRKYSQLPMWRELMFTGQYSDQDNEF